MNHTLKVLIDNSSYDLLNSGDIAMAKICIERLQELSPSISLNVITESDTTLAKISPNAHPLNLFIKRKAWSQKRNIFGPVFKITPKKLHNILENFESKLRLTFPQTMTNWMYSRLSKRVNNAILVKQYFEHIVDTDIAIASGGGFMTDAFEDHAIKILELLYLVKKQGKPTAMFGQGVGPVKSTKLLATMKKVLPTLDLICLRESVSGLQLLLDIGVSKEKIIVTGDDAIELSKGTRKKALGNKLGFNVRVADYATIDSKQDKLVAQIINEFAKLNTTSTIAIPISWYPHEYDLEKISKLLDTITDNQHLNHHNIDGLMERIAECRVVVTGSYHAGVFALSQGIPVIGLARSQYYLDKFKGLSGMFPSGVEVVALESNNWHEDLKAALVYAWNNAELLRQSLLVTADSQVELSKQAYKKFFNIVNHKYKLN